jgi:hypothetical protein
MGEEHFDAGHEQRDKRNGGEPVRDAHEARVSRWRCVPIQARHVRVTLHLGATAKLFVLARAANSPMTQ